MPRRLIKDGIPLVNFSLFWYTMTIKSSVCLRTRFCYSVIFIRRSSFLLLFIILKRIYCVVVIFHAIFRIIKKASDCYDHKFLLAVNLRSLMQIIKMFSGVFFFFGYRISDSVGIFYNFSQILCDKQFFRISTCVSCFSLPFAGKLNICIPVYDNFTDDRISYFRPLQFFCIELNNLFSEFRNISILTKFVARNFGDVEFVRKRIDI